jgi:undecaprenyl-diphosphatase
MTMRTPRSAARTPAVRPGQAAARLLVTVVVLLGVVLGLGWLLTRAKEGDAFEQRDAALVQWFADHRVPLLDRISGPAADLGQTWVVIGVGVVAAAVAGWVFRSWRPVVVLAVLLAGELAIFLTAVTLIDRPRPAVPHLDGQLPPTSSFPSGHTAAALCLYGGVAALVLAGSRRPWRWAAPVLAVLLVLVVATARLYRGAHYPTDVLTSVLFAGTWLLVTLWVLPLRNSRSGHPVESRMGEWGP